MLHIQSASNQWIRLANEWKFRDSRAAGYGLNLPTRLAFFGSGFGTGVRDRATGQWYGTNVWVNDANTEAIQSSGTRAWITLMSTGMGHGNGQRKRATSTGTYIKVISKFTFHLLWLKFCIWAIPMWYTSESHCVSKRATLVFYLISVHRNWFRHYRIGFESGQSFMIIAHLHDVIHHCSTWVIQSTTDIQFRLRWRPCRNRMPFVDDIYDLSQTMVRYVTKACKHSMHVIFDIIHLQILDIFFCTFCLNIHFCGLHYWYFIYVEIPKISIIWVRRSLKGNWLCRNLVELKIKARPIS